MLCPLTSSEIMASLIKLRKPHFLLNYIAHISQIENHPWNFSSTKRGNKFCFLLEYWHHWNQTWNMQSQEPLHHYLEHSYGYSINTSSEGQHMAGSKCVKMWSQPYQKMQSGITFQNQWSPHFCILCSGPVVNRFAKTLMILSIF